MKYTVKVCKKHGETKHRVDSDGHKRCLECQKTAVIAARRRRKIKLVEMAGGKCVECGYKKNIAALNFYHRDTEGKLFGIAASGITRSLKASVDEAKKCDLLCANCTQERIHPGLSR
jgi:Zn ribbon nucleic-acid-binding protein